jgi:hypothetical protein
MFKLFLLKIKTIQPIIIIKFIAIIILFVALANNPYFYYQILRWGVCWLTAYLAYSAYENKQSTWIWIFGISAILYNPISPIYFGREIRSILDIIVAVIIFVSIFKMRLDKK